MRIAQFALPKVGSDTADAELIVFFFGTGQGGDVAQNVARWKTLFVPPAGKTIDQVGTMKSFRVGSAQVTTFEEYGTFLFKQRPMDSNAEAEPRPGSRMIGVVFETAGGPYFLRLVGPDQTVSHYRPEFLTFLKSFK
jgi:hypothetical protein